MRSGVNTMPTQGDEAIFEIKGPAGLQAIGALHERLTEALKNTTSLVVDLTNAEDFDITLIQLIEAGRRHASANRKQITLSAPASGEIADQLERGGFLVRPCDRTFWLHTPETAQ